MHYYPHNMDENLFRKQVIEDNGVLNDGDHVFIGGSASMWILYLGIKEKFEMNYSDINIKVVDSLSRANVLITDDEVETVSILYTSQLNYAFSHQMRVILFDRFSEGAHSKGAIVDEVMFNNLLRMIKSKDKDTLMIACEVMSAANRTDPESINNIIRLISEMGTSLISGINNMALFKESRSTYELFKYVESAHYEQLQKQKFGADSD